MDPYPITQHPFPSPPQNPESINNINYFQRPLKYLKKYTGKYFYDTEDTEFLKSDDTYQKDAKK